MDAVSTDQAVEPIIKTEDCESNPWSVGDASVFLKYHCPECDYYDGDLEIFSDHARENHVRSSTLFDGKKILPKTKNEADKDSSNVIETIKVESDLNLEFDPLDYVEVASPENKCTKGIEIQCDICDLEFNSLEILDLHNTERHRDETGLNWCHHCNLKLKTFNALKSHIDGKHPDHGEKKYFCKDCDETFIFQSTYKTHKLQHKQKQKEQKHQKKQKEKHKKRITKCDICILEFSSLKLLTVHNRDKHESGSCSYCGHKNGSLSNLKVHIDNNHPDHAEKKCFCEQCGKGFIFNVSLSHHMTWKHRENKMCEICGKELTQQNLQEHMLLQHNIRPKDTTDVVCEICGFSTPSKKKLHAHKHAQHQLDKHKNCPHCDFKSPYRQKINIHIDRNHPDLGGEKQFFCELCGTGFIYKDTLNHHAIYLCKNSKSMKKKTNQYVAKKPLEIPCSYCTETFKHSYLAKIHYRNFHPTLPIIFENGLCKYSCGECDDFFFTELELVKHSKLKHEKKSQTVKSQKNLAFKCDYCDEIFSGSKRIKSHYQNWHPHQPIIGEGYMKFNCSECNDFFFIQDELDCHLNLDHGMKTEKNYCKRCKNPYKDSHKCPRDFRYVQKKPEKVPCPQCNVLFSSITNMRSHVKSVHEKILDFECDQCGKKLASMKTLKNHILQSHNQVTCELCHKKVATKTDLRKHKVFVHNDTQGAWLCEKCPKTVFFMKSFFEKHIKEKH